jgi:hypothetical protein
VQAVRKERCANRALAGDMQSRRPIQKRALPTDRREHLITVRFIDHSDNEVAIESDADGDLQGWVQRHPLSRGSRLQIRRTSQDQYPGGVEMPVPTALKGI